MATPHPTQHITLYVCATCDRNPAQQDMPVTEGLAFVRDVKAHFAAQPDVVVKPIKCLGGCECNGTPNGCCSVGITAPQRHSYVINRLNPSADMWKLEELLRLYRERPSGRILCRNSVHSKALVPHIATRIPSATDEIGD